MQIVSKEKKYKLTNKFSKFLEAYEKEEFSFGKAYVYNPKTDYFQGWEKKFLDFFKEYEGIFKRSYYRELNLSEVLNNKRSFDSFIDILREGNQVLVREVAL